MREIRIPRDEMASLSPALVRDCETAADGAAEVGYFLAVAVLPGCEAIPMEVEADPEAIRLWMERALLMQARARVPGRPGRSRAIRGEIPVPARVAALVHLLALDESGLDPDPATLGRRLEARLAHPERDPTPLPPAPAFAPAFR